MERLAFSESLESILAKRFGAMKRFGLEGAESMIPGLKVRGGPGNVSVDDIISASA